MGFLALKFLRAILCLHSEELRVFVFLRIDEADFEIDLFKVHIVLNHVVVDGELGVCLLIYIDDKVLVKKVTEFHVEGMSVAP